MKPLKYANKITHLFGLHVSSTRPLSAFPNHVDDEAVRVIRMVEGLTFLPWSGRFDIYRADIYAAKSVAGDLVECGVWRGGAAIVMAEAVVRAGADNRRLFLYDTFSGMTKPTEKHSRVVGNIGTGSIKKTFDRFADLDRGSHTDWAYAPIEEVQENLKMSRLPQEQFILVKGAVEQTIPETAPEEISVLRLDTDWYGSTKHEMEQLFPRLNTGGVLIIDDYGWWAGSRHAVDEYLALYDKPMFFIENPENGAAIGVKPSNMKLVAKR